MAANGGSCNGTDDHRQWIKLALMKITGFKSWSLALLLLLAAAEVPAQPLEPLQPDLQLPPVYRVEVIVFRHTDGDSDRRVASEPLNFTGIVDPRDRAAAHAAITQGLAVVRQTVPILSPTQIDESTPWLENDDQRLQPIPPFHVDPGTLSAPMQRALERLENSSLTAPLAARSWLQTAERQRRSPAMRIHDDFQVASPPSPAASIKPLFWPHWPPARALVRDGWPQVLGRLFSANPPPLPLYRTDGTVRLYRRQFLHFDIDLVWQQETADASPQMQQQSQQQSQPGFDVPEWLVPGSPDQPGPDIDEPVHQSANEPAWRIHRMQQSRVVRDQRFEYFDSSLLGVLVRLERFEQMIPEIAPVEVILPDPAPDAPPRRR